MIENINSIDFATIDPIVFIEDNIIINGRGDYSLMFSLQTPPVFTLDIDDYDLVNTAYSTAINSLPEDFCLQRLDFNYPMKQSLNTLNAKSYADYKDIAYLNGRQIQNTEVYYIFTRIAKSKVKRGFGNTLFDVLFTNSKSKKKATGLFEEEHYNADEVSNFKYAVYGFINLLCKNFSKNKAFNFTELTKDEIVSVIYGKYFNLDFLAEDNKSFSADKFDLADAGGVVGNSHFTAITMNSDGMPPLLQSAIKEGKFYNKDMGELPVSMFHDLAFNVDAPHIIHQVIYTTDTHKAKETIEKKSKEFNAFSIGSSYNRTTKEKIDAFLDDANSASLKLVNFHYGIIIISPKDDYNVQKENFNKISSVLSGFGLKFTVNTKNSLRYLFSSCPGNASDIPEFQRITCPSSYAACFSIFESNINSDATKGMRFTCRKTGKVFQEDLWEHPAITNYNSATFGPPGTGKSFSYNTLIQSVLHNGYHTVICDVGYSYKNICAYFGGKFIECSEEYPIKLNPFLLSGKDKNGDYIFPNDDTRNFIIKLFFTCWQASSDNKLTTLQISVLDSGLARFYSYINENKIFPDFTEFYLFLIEDVKTDKDLHVRVDLFDLVSWQTVMRIFCKKRDGVRGLEKDGMYSYLMNGTENENLMDNKIVVFELELIRTNKILFPVTYYILTELVLNKLLNYIKHIPDGRLYFVIDEAHFLLSGEYGDTTMFMDYGFRTFRKHSGSFNLATQSVDDVFKNETIGKALKECCDTFILKMQKTENLESIAKTLQLSDHNKNLLFSMQDKYSELYIQSKGEARVVKIEVSPFNHGMFTTNPKEKEFIRNDFEKQKV